MRDASTSMSQERISLMVKYNQIGSMASLSRSRVSCSRDNFSYLRSLISMINVASNVSHSC